MKNIYKIFIGGGGDDWISAIVKDYYNEYKDLNPDYHCSYFSWTQNGLFGQGPGELVRDIPYKAHITIVGHSYGGDAACFALTTRPIDVLITIDPVSYLRVPWSFIRSMTKTWLNVRSEPTWAKSTKDDLIATIGHRYPRPPAPGQASAPNYSLIANESHGRFREMMRLSNKGVSGSSLLGGNRVS